MTIEKARIYCLSEPHATEDLPFPAAAPNYVAFRIADKIFAGLNLNHANELVLKCPPNEFDELTAIYPSIEQAWHWHKRHWIQIALNGQDITEELVESLINRAYESVLSQLPQKKKMNLKQPRN